jgi:hypothetical protein
MKTSAIVKGATSRFDNWTGITPIIQELPPCLGPARSGHRSNGSRATPVEGPHLRAMNAELRGDAVLVDQAAEPVGSLDSVRFGERLRGRVEDWDLKGDPAVRTLVVVVLDELVQRHPEVLRAPDEQPVEALGPGCSHEPFGERVRAGRPHRCLDDPGADSPHHLVEGTDAQGDAGSTSCQ